MSQQQTYRVEVWSPFAAEGRIDDVPAQAIQHIGIHAVQGCFIARIFFVRGNITQEDVERISLDLLADPVTEQFAVSTTDTAHVFNRADHTVEVTLLPGVTDPVAENLVRAAHVLGITGVELAATGQRYLIEGNLTHQELERLATELFANPVIQRYDIDRPISPPFVPFQQTDSTVDVIPLRNAGNDRLMAISAERRLALNLLEMESIRTYYQQEQREPADIELEMLAQTWSEHCGHKSFRATVTYTGPRPGADPHSPPAKQTIKGLLKTYIRAATEQVNKPWVYSAFVDNAGIIAFDDTWDLAFKLETHNHPSALEPFGGSNTGVGGVVRDILGVSARPIANTDVLCFGPQDLPESRLPDGVLHPRRIESGVVHGIEDYGNKMGIPTVNGAIYYHEGYTSNPLVYCGCLGLLPHGSHRSEARPGDLVIVIGGRTGRDGLRGATFSSMEMDKDTSQVAGSAVQIGHPINEKQVQEVVLQARDAGLYTAITDCGAGGLSSAVGEMGKTIGARVRLETVPLKYPGLRPWEIWLSEAQERMVMAVPPENWPRIQELCALHDIEGVCIGEFEASGRFHLSFDGKLVGDLSAEFLHEGDPTLYLDAEWSPPAPKKLDLADINSDPSEILLKLLAHPNIRSKEAVVRRYDHEVQAGTIVKPMVGVDNHGPGDATVLSPLDTMGSIRGESWPKGASLAVGICPSYGDIDPYAMAWAAIDETMRNLVAVGTDPDQVALLDNFCWGSPNLPDRLGSLVRCSQGCYDAAIAYGAPFVSGKDSLNNEFAVQGGGRQAIPGTLLISGLGIVPDVSKTVTMSLKHAGNLLYIVGDTRDELGGSHYAIVQGLTGGQVPQPVLDAMSTLRAVYQAIRAGTVQACHDCSEGGIGVALAEMCLAGRLGAEIRLANVPQSTPIQETDVLLFSESISRFIIEVRPEDKDAFDKVMASIPHNVIGMVSDEPALRIDGLQGKSMHVPVDTLEHAWRDIPTGGSTDQPIEQSDNRTIAQSHNRPTVAIHAGPKRVAILHAKGTNRDRDAALACEAAGGQPEIVYVNELIGGEKHLQDYAMLVVPGGFSYGDDLGGGVLWAVTLMHELGDSMRQFVKSGRPVLGICNGFQVLVKAGLLPGPEFAINGRRPVTLTYNKRRRFECRWVYLKPNPNSTSLFTEGLDELIFCPVAHGEGRLLARDQDTLDALWEQNLAALTYVDANGLPAAYPANPNGSALGIAGLCNPEGNVMGLMPHPEDHIFPWQHPHRHRGEVGMTGLKLFERGLGVRR
ncbi:MAG: phosphoribosylformylglycinamidine synthase subunit PurL [Anaerolineae bacterium]|nr:phosphoribosylformylglycinamidine synthase subunit PurL [Anaerolineae bacterium]